MTDTNIPVAGEPVEPTMVPAKNLEEWYRNAAIAACDRVRKLLKRVTELEAGRLTREHGGQFVLSAQDCNEYLDAHRAKPSPQSPSGEDDDAPESKFGPRPLNPYPFGKPGNMDWGNGFMRALEWMRVVPSAQQTCGNTANRVEPSGAKVGSSTYETAPTLEKRVSCEACDGRGARAGIGDVPIVDCSKCKGTGLVVRVTSAPARHLDVSHMVERERVSPLAPGSHIGVVSMPAFDDPREPDETLEQAVSRAVADDSGPPRVGDVVRVEELYEPDIMSKRYAVGSQHVYAGASGNVRYLGRRWELSTPGCVSSNYVSARLSVIRRAAQSPPATPEPIQTSPFREVSEKSAVPWRPLRTHGFATAAELADVVRQLGLIVDWILAPAGSDTRDAHSKIRAEREARKL